MKKIVLILTSIFIAAFVFVNQGVGAAQAETSTQSATIAYDLTYPGILPDSPLYKLKVLRDRIEEILIFDPMSKINFYLLQTDKGILASAILVDKKAYQLAIQTALKAENNYTLLTQQLGNLPRRPGDATFKKLEKAALKHQEVIGSLINRVPDKYRKDLQNVILFSKMNWATIHDYQTQK